MAKTEFFNKLSDKLDELFPKGDKRRGDALVLNAFANILLEEEKKKAIEKGIEGFVEFVDQMFIEDYIWMLSYLEDYMIETRDDLQQEEDKNGR